MCDMHCFGVSFEHSFHKREDQFLSWQREIGEVEFHWSTVSELSERLKIPTRITPFALH